MKKNHKQRQKKDQQSILDRIIEKLSIPSIPYLILIILTCLVFLQTVKFDVIEFDDKRIIEYSNKMVSENSLIDGLTKDPYFKNEGAIFYRPIQNLSIMIDTILSSNDYVVYHFTNLLFHILTVVLVYLILNLLGQNLLTALFLSLIFALHPILNFNVSWIASRGDILATLFSLISFTFFIKYIRDRKSINLVLNIFFYLLAGFSKESAILLPGVFILYYYLVHDKTILNKDIGEVSFSQKLIILAGWALGFIIFFVVRSLVIHNKIGVYNFELTPFISNLRYIPEYIFKIFIPIRLSGLTQFSTLPTVVGTIIFSVIIGIIIAKKNSINYKRAIFGLLWFLIFLFPIIILKQSYLPTGEYWEHRAYMPIVGLIIVISEFISLIKLNRNALVISIIILTSAGIYSFSNTKNYSNSFNFYDNIIKCDVKLAEPFFKRGVLFMSESKPLEAIADFSKALEINPVYISALMDRGAVYRSLGNLKSAIDDFKAILKINTNHINAGYNLAVCFYESGDKKTAINLLNKILELDKNYKKASDLLQKIGIN